MQYVLDCLGDICPTPMIKLLKRRKLYPAENILLITDHSCVCESVSEYCRKTRLSLRIEEPVNGVWELYISP